METHSSAAPEVSDTTLEASHATQVATEVQASDADMQTYYLRIHDAITKAQLSNDEKLDNTILTIASAALALSIHFISRFTVGSGVWVLKTGWMSLILAISLVVVGYYLSKRALTVAKKNADDFYLRRIAQASERRNHWDEIHTQNTLAYSACFVIGLVCILVFFTNVDLVNTSEERMAPDDKKAGNKAAGPDLPDSLQKVAAGASSPQLIPVAQKEDRAATAPAVVVPPARTAASPQESQQSSSGGGSGGAAGGGQGDK